MLLSLCLFPLAACKKEKLAPPVNLTIDEDNNLIWEKVDNAKNYHITFNFITDNTVKEADTRKTSYSLNELEVGDYEIVVKAMPGDPKSQESKNSEILYFHKYFETGCVYSLINNKTEYEITKVGRANGTFEIEDFYRGKAVTKIAEKAFKGSQKVIEIKLGSNISSIGDNAFYNCGKLKTLILPENVREIGRACFQSCKSLEEIIIPETILTIPEYCFAYCRSLERVSLPETLETIGVSAFQDCSSLLEMNIPDRVSEIGTYAFHQNTLLKKVTVGSSVEKIETNTFYGCLSLTDIIFNENSSLKLIDEQAFMKCTSLKEAELPAGLEDIGKTSFYDCSSLEKITIPDSVHHIGIDAFTGTKFHTDAINNNDRFIYADNWLIQVNSEFRDSLEVINTETLSNTIVGIADNTFYGSPNLKTLVLPASFKYIGQYAFALCPQLWKIRTLDDSIELIDDFAFSSCSISNVLLGIGLKRIGKYAFYNNPQLDNNSLNPTGWIPETLTSMGTDAFRETQIYKKASSTPQKIVYAGNWVAGIVREYEVTGSVNLQFDPDRVAGIADYAFFKQPISSVQGLSSCRYIGKGAFSMCSNLVNVSLNRNLTEISDFAFEQCSNLIRVTLPRTLKNIGNYAFYRCNSLSEIDLSSTNCESIGKSAFFDCFNMTSVTLSKNLKSIDEMAFFSCSSLVEITIPDNVTDIGNKCFLGCIELKKATIGNSLVEIPDSAFYDCTMLKTINIPLSVKKIGRSAFYKNERLENITIDEGLEEIGDYAFFETNNLKNVVFPSSLSKIGNFCFKGSKLEEVHLMSTISKIGQHAFYGCKNMVIYSDSISVPGEWHERFNSSNRPVFWGTEFNDDGSVKSIIISNETSINLRQKNEISLPKKENMVFNCFRDQDLNEYSMDDLKDIQSIEGGVKLIAVFKNNNTEGEGSSSSNE